MVWLWVGMAAAIELHEIPDPRAAGGWVTDLAEILDAADEDALNTTLHALEDDLQVEVAVVTVDDVAGSPREFAMNLGNHWGLGDAQTNNGLVVLLVVGKRRLEMQTGYGLEKALDEGWLTQMQEAHMVPAFKRGDFGAGLVAGIGQVDRRLRRDPDATREGARAPASGLDQDPASSSPRWPAVPLEVAVLGVGGATGGGLLLSVLGLRHRRRQRTCPMCGVYMPMLDEVSDDAHLSEGQRTEEEIRSVDWQVHQCPQCEHTRTFRSNKWLSGYSSCPGCGNRSRKSERTTIRSATEHSTGEARIDESCAHCDYAHTYTRSIPRVSSSSSFGGGGSSGGGSFGGSGGGSSW